MKKNYLWKWLAVMMVATLGIFITSCNPTPEPELSVSTTDIKFNGTADYQKIAVTARHTDWVVEVLEGRDWITAGKTNNMVNVSVKENPNKDSRKGSIQISATEDAALYHIIYVTQEGGSTKLSVKPENVSFSASGGEQNIQVTCNTEWSVRGGNDWLTVEKLNQKTIALSAKKNETSEKLETTITVSTDDGEGTQNVKVSIAASEQKLTISGLDAPFEATKGSITTAQVLKITCNSEWVISGKPDWLSFEALTGVGNAEVRVWTSQDNPSSDNRSATIKVRSGNLTEPKEVTQLALYSPVYARPINSVTLATSLVYGYDFHKDTQRVYFTLMGKNAANGLTDNDVITYIKNYPEEWESRTPEQFNQHGNYFSWTKISPNTEYVLISLAIDGNNKIGEINRQGFVTPKDDPYNCPYISRENLNVSYAQVDNKVVYNIQAKKDAQHSSYANKFYSWAVAGTSNFMTLTYNSEAILAYLILLEIGKNPAPHDTYINGTDRNEIRERLEGPVEEANYTLPANYGNDRYVQVVNWCTLASGAFSGKVTESIYQITNNSSMRLVKKNRIQVPRVIQFNPQKLQKDLKIIRLN